VVLIKVIKRKK